jgi:hypothetical protein
VVAGYTSHVFDENLETLRTTFHAYDGTALYVVTTMQGAPLPPQPKYEGSCAVYGCGSYNEAVQLVREGPRRRLPRPSPPPPVQCQCSEKCASHNNCCTDFKHCRL